MRRLRAPSGLFHAHLIIVSSGGTSRYNVLTLDHIANSKLASFDVGINQCLPMLIEHLTNSRMELGTSELQKLHHSARLADTDIVQSILEYFE